VPPTGRRPRPCSSVDMARSQPKWWRSSIEPATLAVLPKRPKAGPLCACPCFLTGLDAIGPAQTRWVSGFVGNRTGGNPPPTSVTLNGTGCSTTYFR
jgi:hypothetical protein